MSNVLLESNFAVAAAENYKGSHGCWETADVPVVTSLLKAWRKQHKLAHVPLFLLGPSSGGFFATQLARHERDVRAVSIQVSVPSRDDVSSPLPSGADRFPPLQIILMQKDSGKLKEADALIRTGGEWPGRDSAQLLTSQPKPVHPAFFSDGIVGLSYNVSANVRAELVRAGKLDERTSRLRSHPRREEWREAVRRGLMDEHGRIRRDELPQKSLALAMDGIFARLDLAYAFHASTCEHAAGTVAFFRKALHLQLQP